jgi:hypothetical protein
VTKLPAIIIGKGPGSGGRLVSDDPEVELLHFIKTGDDVVEFYARQGKESEVKFFYCNRADTGIFFRPYDLVRNTPSPDGHSWLSGTQHGIVTREVVDRLGTHRLSHHRCTQADTPLTRVGGACTGGGGSTGHPPPLPPPLHPGRYATHQGGGSMHRRWWIDWAPTASPTTVAPRPIRHSPRWGEHAQEVVSRAEVKAEYFTISASGVVHLKAGARSEFAPLGEWMREKSIFNVLTRMKFFKHYLVRVPTCRGSLFR